MTEKQRYPREAALVVAKELVEMLRPYSERIAISGSICRGRPDVGDIEILAIPQPFGVFEFGCHKLLEDGVWEKRPDIRGLFSYGPKNKYLRHRESGIPVDVFTSTVENFGMASMVRTGPAEWCVKFMALLKALGTPGHAYAGITDADGVMHDCPDEETVFRFLGWDFVTPERRG